MSTLHVCRSPVERFRIVAGDCPTCGRWTRFVGFFYEWYGWHETCLRCGDQWSCGELLERPFRPRWRKESIAQARAAAHSWLREARP
jgi:hypothetical protein